MESETVRLRTVFDDRSILSKSQKSSGLKRSWLLLKPHHQTISDLASYILQAFDLENACSNGIILSMDGYVLPPFESTCLLKDKDVISVTKKKGMLCDFIQLGDGGNSLEMEIVEKQPVHRGLMLLANEEFEKETGGYESESEEEEDGQSGDAPQGEITPVKDKTSKKRKASKELRSPKSKKRKHTSLEKHLVTENIGDDVLAKQNRSSSHDMVLSKKKLSNMDKSCLVQREQDEMNASNIDKQSNDRSKSSSSAKQSHGLEEKGEKHLDALRTPGTSSKVPSRSARRKKAKRQWLRLVKQEKKELYERQILHQDNQQSPEKDNDIVAERHLEPYQNNSTPSEVACIFSEKHQKSDQNGDAEEHYVPVVVRPGHIRFKPLGEDHGVQQNNQVPVETFQWNGITSKKKGQKWGMEKFSSGRQIDHRNPSPESPLSSEVLTIEEESSINDPLDFDKLAPYPSMPKEGDLVAYRLLELSSSWTPELSSFRVGKISRYDPGSNNIMLAPVPAYPIASEKDIDEEASELQSNTPLYAEDGTLEINFSSLVDIRTVKHGNLDLTQAVTGGIYGVHLKNGDAPSDHNINVNSDETLVPTQENGQDEINVVLNVKKAQLCREDDQSKKENTGRKLRSFRGLRSSAMGPTMSLLRAQNQL